MYGCCVHDSENSLNDLHFGSYFQAFSRFGLDVSCWLPPILTDQALHCALSGPVKNYSSPNWLDTQRMHECGRVGADFQTTAGQELSGV